jgi:hypothetical protein
MKIMVAARCSDWKHTGKQVRRRIGGCNREERAEMIFSHVNDLEPGFASLPKPLKLALEALKLTR